VKKIWTRHNRIELLEGGENYFDAVIEAIQSAKREIYCFAYIYLDQGMERKSPKA